MIYLGGNQKLQIFFDKYRIDPKSSPDYKYKTKAAIYYREMLKAKIEGGNFINDPPSLEEGIKLGEISCNY